VTNSSGLVPSTTARLGLVRVKPESGVKGMRWGQRKTRAQSGYDQALTKWVALSQVYPKKHPDVTAAHRQLRASVKKMGKASTKWPKKSKW
jgi:hypothetical protein